MSNFESIKIANQICHPIYSASNALQRIYKPILEPLKLTYPQYLVMMVLWEQDGVSITHISEKTYFDSGTLTPLLQKLKKTGYISITSDPNDQRIRLINLTKSGKQLKLKASEVPQKLTCFMPFKSVSEFKEFKRLMEQFYQALVSHS